MAMTKPERRYHAADKQRWMCWICGTPMVDRRTCDGLCGPRQHIEIKQDMPRFNLGTHASRLRRGLSGCTDQLHYGDPHAASFADDHGVMRAVHLSCALSVRSAMNHHGGEAHSAIHRLRVRAGESATCELHDRLVDNGGKRNQKAQLEPLEKRHSPVAPLQKTHSVEQQQPVRTEVEAHLARVNLPCPYCSTLVNHRTIRLYDPMPCCGRALHAVDVMRLSRMERQ